MKYLFRHFSSVFSPPFFCFLLFLTLQFFYGFPFFLLFFQVFVVVPNVSLFFIKLNFLLDFCYILLWLIVFLFPVFMLILQFFILCLSFQTLLCQNWSLCTRNLCTGSFGVCDLSGYSFPFDRLHIPFGAKVYLRLIAET